MSVPILTQLKKVVQRNKAYFTQKNAELAETTAAALTEMQANKQSAPLCGSATIPAFGWNSDGAAPYSYYYDIAVVGVTDKDYPTVTIALGSLEAARSCGLCPNCESLEGKVRLRAANLPTSAIQLNYWIEKGKD